MTMMGQSKKVMEGLANQEFKWSKRDVYTINWSWNEINATTKSLYNWGLGTGIELKLHKKRKIKNKKEKKELKLLKPWCLLFSQF